ncbi:hypothetical protein JXQ70_04815 [bacterium]|nr:hypothetical protein [bacterium]
MTTSSSDRILSRNFLLSLTCSLGLHLIVLIIILVPTNYELSAQANYPAQETDNEFSPSLLISYSTEKMEQAIVEVADFNTMVPRESSHWRLDSFKQSFQQSSEQKKLDISTLSLLKNERDQNTYSVKVVLRSTIESVLSDCLCLCYLTGVATAKSNFRTDYLYIIFTHESGEIINLKALTSDCRSYAHQKISVNHFMQKITLA